MRPVRKRLSLLQFYVVIGALFGSLFPLTAHLLYAFQSGISFIQTFRIGDPILLITDSAPFILAFFSFWLGKYKRVINETNAVFTQSKLLNEAESMAQLGSWFYDVLAEKVIWSQQMYRIFDVAPDQPPLSYEAHKKAIYSEDIDYWFMNVNRCLEDGTPFHIHYRVKHKNGQLIWVEGRGEALKNEDGKVIALQGTSQNITAQKNEYINQKVISDLRKAYLTEKHTPYTYYETILTTLKILTSSNHGFIYAQYNDKLSSPEIVLSTAKKNLLSGDLEVLNQSKFFEKNRLSFGEFFIYPIHLEDQSLLMIGLENNYPQIKNILEVITDMVNLVIARKKKNEIAAKNELMIFASELGLWDWDLNSNQAHFDTRWCEILGYQPHEVEQTIQAWENLTHPEDLNPTYKVISDYLTGKIPEYTVKVRMKHKKGHYVTILSKGKILERDNVGKPVRFVGTHLDASEVVHMEEQLNEQSKIAEHSARLASIGQLAAGVGHEINNPLAIAFGHVDKIRMLLKNEVLNVVSVEESMKKIHKSLERIQNIVKGLRTFSRKKGENYRVFQVADVLSETVFLLQEIYGKLGVNIKVLELDKTLKVKANPEELQQVLVNLISNAKDATEKKTERLIEISLKNKDHHAFIEVKDNGGGISDKDKNKIFETFFTTKEVGKGTGIGLSISAKIIHELNGKIYFNSSPGVGTSFFIEIPLEGEVIKESASATTPFPSVLNSPVAYLSSLATVEPTQDEFIALKKLGLNILIAEDEELIREIISDMVTTFAKQVFQCGDGESALELLKKEKIDLMITDYTMPKMDGSRLITELYADASVHKPKIILLTGAVSLEANKLKKDLKISCIISKPFSNEALHKAMIDLFVHKKVSSVA